MSQCSTTRAATMSSCAKTDSVSPNTLCVTMTTTAVMGQTSPRSVVSATVTSYSLFLLSINTEFNGPKPSCCFLLQNIRHVDPTSSAVPMDAASSRVRGSVMETLTAMTTQTKPPRTPTATGQVSSTQPLQKHTFTDSLIFICTLSVHSFRPVLCKCGQTTL